MQVPLKKPEWLRTPRLPVGDRASGVLRSIAEHRLNTVCTSAACPNKGACFAEGTATFMILGAVCTRSCGFCNVGQGRPVPPDPGEPRRVGPDARVARPACRRPQTR